MSQYLGDFRVGQTVRFWWNSNAVAGESATRGTNGTISVYKDSSDTQSTSGVTDGEDSDGLTGVHRGVVDLSSDGTFYSAGSDFAIVLSGAAIDGKSVNAVLAQFSVENRSALMPAMSGRYLNVSSAGLVDADIKQVNGVAVTGDGAGTPWGPE